MYRDRISRWFYTGIDSWDKAMESKQEYSRYLLQLFFNPIITSSGHVYDNNNLL